MIGRKLALRVTPAVTRLTVYRWLNIPALVRSAATRSRKNVFLGDLWVARSQDPSMGARQDFAWHLLLP